MQPFHQSIFFASNIFACALFRSASQFLHLLSELRGLSRELFHLASFPIQRLLQPRFSVSSARPQLQRLLSSSQLSGELGASLREIQNLAFQLARARRGLLRLGLELLQSLRERGGERGLHLALGGLCEKAEMGGRGDRVFVQRIDQPRDEQIGGQQRREVVCEQREPRGDAASRGGGFGRFGGAERVGEENGELRGVVVGEQRVQRRADGFACGVEDL